MATKTAELSAIGVSIWLDDLSRERITSGGLQKLIDERDVVGVTTNPTIFAGALAKGQAYDEQVGQLGGLRARRSPTRSSRSRRTMSPPAATSSPPCTPAQVASTVEYRSRSNPDSPTTPLAPSPRHSSCGRRSRSRTP